MCSGKLTWAKRDEEEDGGGRLPREADFFPLFSFMYGVGEGKLVLGSGFRDAGLIDLWTYTPPPLGCAHVCYVENQ